ncbi:hypothetical protein TorRG33x02_337280 [Trema orientale]|uniref:Uncharacterized protein n=1 Tax=Trema orientale TaxID=63057 RepID=A0A2P5AZC2_TREOI|nr:hypothetical protein TorRG33x02_337280 [Trema orientale]
MGLASIGEINFAPLNYFSLKLCMQDQLFPPDGDGDFIKPFKKA